MSTRRATGLWSEIFHWRVLLRWDVLSWILATTLGFAGLFLFFDQFWGANVCFVLFAAFVVAKVAAFAIESPGPSWQRLLFALPISGVIVFLAAGAVWGVSVWRSAHEPPPTQETLRAKSYAARKGPFSLHELFETDWPNLISYYSVATLTCDGPEPRKVTVGWRLNGDFVSRSKFLAFFIGSTVPAPDALRVSRQIAHQYNRFIGFVDSHVDMVGQTPDETSATHLKEMVFSGRVFIYYGGPGFSLSQEGSIETVFETEGLSVEFRGARYAWLHRDDLRWVPAKPRVPNTVILPHAPTPGWRIHFKFLK